MVPAFFGLFSLFAAVGGGMAVGGGDGDSSSSSSDSDRDEKQNASNKAEKGSNKSDKALSKAAVKPKDTEIVEEEEVALVQDPVSDPVPVVVVEPEPEPEQEPVLQEPDPLPEPEPEPVLQQDPVEEQPEPDLEPVVQPEPVEEDILPDLEPVLEQDPVREQPEPDAEPVVQPEPVEEQPEPVLQQDPLEEQPEPDVEPVVQPEPVEEDILPEPEPVVQPEPVEENIVPEPEPIVQPEPVTPGSTSGPETIDASIFTGSGTIEGGRVTTFEMNGAENISGIKVTNLPDHGNVVINPDNSVAVVMTGSTYSGQISFDLEVSYADGTSATQSATLDVTTPKQDLGWGLGKHYMLEEDDNGEIIVETGEFHRPVYITEGTNGLTKAEIAAMEGLQESQITTQWLIDNPVYGGSEDKALATDIGMDVWNGITATWSASSHWLLLEKGYTYSAEDMNTVIPRMADGESAMNPLHVTSWGDGERPLIESQVRILFEDMHNIVISDVNLGDGIMHLGGANLLLDDVLVSGGGVNVQNLSGFTIHDSEITGVVNTKPAGDTWSAFADRSAGTFTAVIDGLLVEDSIWHRNGWEEGYDGTLDNGQPPSQWSHNIYFSHNTFDVTFRDNIVSQGSSWGLMARGGGYIEDNLFIDNNAAVSFDGGNYNDAGQIGNFSLFTDNVITSGAHKEAPYTGALTMGVQNKGEMSTLLDNIIAHMADPNDPDDIAKKFWGHDALSNVEDPFYDDTIIYAWDGVYKTQLGITEDKNTEGLNEDVLNQTTIQQFAEALLGADKATINDLMDHIVSLGGTALDDTFEVDDIIEYFQNGFQIAPNGDESQTDHTFIPNDLADGVRWDNRLNWDTEDAPDDGDSVNLNGNWVHYGGNTDINNVDLGSNGKLYVNNGKLTIEGSLEAGEAGGMVATENVGQLWIDGYSDTDRITFEIGGGRFANTGEFTGTSSINVTDGQALLGVDDATMVIGDGSELRIDGSDMKVGFDGQTGGNAVLQMTDNAMLSFVADDNGFGTIEEFRSGRFDQEDSNVQSGVSLDGTMQIDVSAMSGVNGSHTLIEVDALTGVLDDIHVHGLAAGQDAEVLFDYDNDQVILNLTSGTGAVSFITNGDDADSSGEDADLWAALTSGQGTYDDNPPDATSEEEELPELAA